MAADPVVEEVRAVRDAWAKEYGYDIKAIVAAIQQEEARSGHPVVTLIPRRLEDTPAFRKAG